MHLIFMGFRRRSAPNPAVFSQSTSEVTWYRWSKETKWYEMNVGKSERFDSTIADSTDTVVSNEATLSYDLVQKTKWRPKVHCLDHDLLMFCTSPCFYNRHKQLNFSKFPKNRIFRHIGLFTELEISQNTPIYPIFCWFSGKFWFIL